MGAPWEAWGVLEPGRVSGSLGPSLVWRGLGGFLGPSRAPGSWDPGSQAGAQGVSVWGKSARVQCKSREEVARQGVSGTLLPEMRRNWKTIK